ncbi:MAG: polysaccharide biosynthesis/export family protein [Gammaproteobacteria bacterium]
MSFLFRLTIQCVVLALGLVSATQVVAALAGLESAGDLTIDQQAEQLQQPVNEEPGRTDWRTGGYGEIPPGADSESQDNIIQPFGSELFSGKGFAGVRADGLSPDYRVVPGDQITLRIWGAVELERIQPVDAKGNIFIPAIGPVKVQGLTNAELSGRVREAVRTVYPENVSVYTNLQGVQPVAVFVSGYVNKPGHYAGTPDGSVLYFLAQAGGIDNALGSYRKISIKRSGSEIAQVDLYDFLTKGTLKELQFRDGDTIVVGPRGAAVQVAGDVLRAYSYELLSNELYGAALLKMARLQPNVSYVLLRGGRDEGPFSTYRTMSEFAEQRLRDGDDVFFSADWYEQTIVVQLEGSFYGPSRYTLPKDVRLTELLSVVSVPEELTDTASVSIRRVSVAERQKKALTDSLQRLESSYLGASSATPEESAIRVKEAQLIREFVAKASRIEPNGRLVVAKDSGIADIRLQDGDVITLPEINDSILISGEVLVPQAAVFQQGMSVRDYIDGSGGFTKQADDDKILIVRRNGEVREENAVALRPGDEILVLPKAPTKNLSLATSITQILYQIAIATSVALNL